MVESNKEIIDMIRRMQWFNKDAFLMFDDRLIAEVIKQMHERNKKLWDSISPTWETINRRFDV